MKIFRRITAILGGICIFGIAGTDQMYIQWGQIPPKSVEQFFVIGLILFIPQLVHFIFRKEV